MTNEEINALQEIADKILLLISKASCFNEALDSITLEARQRICLLSEDLQLKRNGQEIWTKKEIKELPFLKDLKYRKIRDVHQFRYRREGYNVQFSSKDLQIAKQKARTFIMDLKKEQIKFSPVLGKTVDDVFDCWIKLKKAHCDKKTYRVYLGVYNNHVRPVFGQRAVKNVLPMDLQPFFDELYSRQERTCEDSKIILNGIFKYAVANRLCSSNPVEGCVVYKHYRTPGNVLTEEQLDRFKKDMSIAGSHGLAALIILYTGIRGAELPTLTFDWKNGTFTVKNAKLKNSQKSVASNIYRTVPIFPALYLLKDRIENEDWKLKTTTLTCKFKNYWKENTVKDLRHTWTSKARESGIENELVNLWMGHLPGKNLAANIYTHFSMEYQKQEALKFKLF